jgi:hypothetical protein
MFREVLEEYIKSKCIPVGEFRFPLKEITPVQTWNKGYLFYADMVFVREDGSVMMEGEYCGKRDNEFISYISNIKDVFQLYENLK